MSHIPSSPGVDGVSHHAKDIVILQHTDCGITRLAGDSAMLAHYFQIPESDVVAKAALDPCSAVAMDVASLREITALPASWMISGINYDVTTGTANVPATVRCRVTASRRLASSSISRKSA